MTVMSSICRLDDEAAIDYNFIQFTTGEATDGAPGETMEEFFNALMGGGHIDLGSEAEWTDLLASGYSSELGAMVLFVIDNNDDTRIDASDAAYAITAVEMTWDEYNALTEDDMAELIGFYNSSFESFYCNEDYASYKECDECCSVVKSVETLV